MNTSMYLTALRRPWRAALLAVGLLGAAATSGCLSTSAVLPGARMAIAAHPGVQRMQRLRTAQDAQDYAQVLTLVRQEIAQPTVDTPEYSAQLRIIAITALGKVASDRGVEASYDAEMAQWSAEALRSAAGAPALGSAVRIAVGNYWASTNRPGRTLAPLLEDLAYQRQVGELYQQARALDGIASAYHAMGEGRLRDVYRTEALRLAHAFFAPGRTPAPTPAHWLSYSGILAKAISDAAERRDAEAMDALWPRRWAIARQWLSPEAISYVETAKQYVVAGQAARAEQLFSEARERWAGERSGAMAQERTMEADFTCLRSMIATAKREATVSAALAQQCLDGVDTLGFAREPGTMLQAGLAFELAGDNARADTAFTQGAELLEPIRGSYSVAERAAFFASPTVRRMHWGRIRVAAHSARAAGDSPARFFEAVARAEAMRARQLGELVGRDDAVTAASLQAFADQLPESELIVGFTVMDEATFVTAFGPRVRRSGFVPLPRAALETRIRDLLVRLGDRSSNARELERALGALSGELLAPILPMMQGRTRLTFVPDGALALLPPNLLGVERGVWRPLGAHADVTITPALRFIMNKGARPAPRDSLWALADPAYPEHLDAAGDPALVAQAAGPSARGALRRVRGRVQIPALPETRDEVQAIAKLFGPLAVESHFGTAATKAGVLSARLEQVRYLHLATHGVLAGELPGLGEPALLLAAGAQPEDSLLRASDAERLRVGALLTVLSACSTGSGTVHSGEGAMSMSRAFLVAGSRHVLMSMWPVDSFATTEFMQSFYRFHRGGDDLATAHRRALVSMKARRTHPMFWAPFVLVRS